MKNLQAIQDSETKTMSEVKPNTSMQPTMDIVTVTCNDQKWFPAYLDSLIRQKGVDLSKINLVVVDNNSKEENFQVLLDCLEKGKKHLGSFELLRQDSNLGFAGACNVGAFKTTGDLVFFLNIDTELEPNALGNYFKCLAEKDEQFGAWEFRQFPYEHPKIHNPLTGEISWASGAALIVKREIFNKIKGFDTNFYMYTDDVDISWRIRLEGYKIKYLPECVVYHYSYQSFNDIKPLQYYYSIFNNLQLRFKFGTLGEIKDGFKLIRNVFRYKGPFENSRKKLINLFVRSCHKFVSQRIWYYKHKKDIRSRHPYKFIGFDYENRREGDFYYNELPKTSPLVSVIVRTVNRPHILKETLISLQKQTYKNLEIIVVEDGPNYTERFIKNDFKDLNIRYFSMGKKAGRTKAGNHGLKMSTGKYLCFLDDDDILYADHFEGLVRQSERNPAFKIFHNFGFEARTRTVSKIPYVYNFESMETIHKKGFNLMRLALFNFLPIQAVMFHHDVYDDLGGFDETLDVLEDWDLWVRYGTKYEFYTVFKTCSIYKVPAEQHIANARRMQFDLAYSEVRKKQQNYSIVINPIKLSELHKKIDK